MKGGGRVMTFPGRRVRETTQSRAAGMPTKSGVARRGLQGLRRDHVEPGKESAK